MNTTNISTKFDISLRMLSCSSKDGAVLRRATLKILLLSSPPSKSVVLPFGCSFIDDTIYISQLIKNETGLNYTQYITELRIEKAKELLTNTKLSLAEISEAVGFNDYFYFIKKFKREVGVTPGKFLQHEKGTGDMPDRERE